MRRVECVSCGRAAGRTFDFHREHPALLRLLLWEALSRPVEMALKDPERQAHYDRKIDAFKAAGMDDQEARYALLTVLALTTYTRVLPQVTALILGSDHSDEDLKTKIIDEVARLTSVELAEPGRRGR